MLAHSVDSSRDTERAEEFPRLVPDVGRSFRPTKPDLPQLYARYRSSLVAHCARFLRDSALAEDATHEVFLRVQRHAGELPDASLIRPWLFRVATNYCLNELRSRDVRDRFAAAGFGVQPQSVDEALLSRNDAKRFLERLHPRARAVAWLTYVDGMLQREVAATLGVSRRTVVNHLSEVRARMEETSAESSR